MPWASVSLARCRAGDLSKNWSKARNVEQVRRIAAISDPAIRAELSAARPLRYTVEPRAEHGIPGYVRAASAIRRVGSRLVVVQDDVNALAAMELDGTIEPLLMPPGPDGLRTFDHAHGNKKLKMDLESAVLLPDGRLAAFGSGASPLRENLVILEPDRSIGVHHAPELFVQMRSWCESMGVELNIEGAIVQQGRLRLLQRSTGRRHASARVGGAVFSFELEAFLRWLARQRRAPDLSDVLEVDLGSFEGLPFGFTDAAITADGRIAFIACVEDSEDARSDGPILACRFGWLDDAGARMTDIMEMDGRPTCLKLEGIEPRPGSNTLLDVVADMDRPDEPSVLLELRISE